MLFDTFALWPSYLTLRFLLKINENLCWHKNVYTFIYNHQN